MKPENAIIGKLAEAYLQMREARKEGYQSKEQDCLTIMETLFWVLDKREIDPLSERDE